MARIEQSEAQDFLLNYINVLVWYLEDRETLGVVNQAFADMYGVEQTGVAGLTRCFSNLIFAPTEEEKTLLVAASKVFAL